MIFLGNWNVDFTCQRHDILITPHKRNEVERSVGDGGYGSPMAC